MNVTFDKIEIGKFYSRHDLAKAWGYNGIYGLSKGLVSPRDTNLVILFMTEKNEELETQYRNRLEHGVFEMQVPAGATPDKRITNAEDAGDQIHLFYRLEDRSDFQYLGEIFLFEQNNRSDETVILRFSMDDYRITEAQTYGIDLENFVSDPEGRKRVSQSIRYERSSKNRKAALKEHGNKCLVCKFDFDAFYGAQLARGFIQVHHTRSVTEMEGETLDIKTDLAPVCANCHCMVHRKRGEIIPIEDLKAIVKKQKQIDEIS